MDINQDVAAKIDHTLLRVDGTENEIEQLCQEALVHGFASVCIHPYWLPFIRSRHKALRLCTVIAFPLGMQTVKVQEAQNALSLGAEELDIVVNHAQVLRKDWDAIRAELDAFRRLDGKATLKLILETCRLGTDQIETLCRLASDAKFDFVKTSTGFAEKGATVESVRLMKASVTGPTRVKASGGIKDWATARAMFEAGAERIGSSSSVAILAQARV